VKGQPIIRLHMEAYLGAPESYDAAEIIGRPNLSMKIAGGVHGDIATASITVNSIAKCSRRRRGCTPCAACRFLVVGG
jgi:4-hydroxy-tetrahydrodipicolinate reductase